MCRTGRCEGVPRFAFVCSWGRRRRPRIRRTFDRSPIERTERVVLLSIPCASIGFRAEIYYCLTGSPIVLDTLYVFG